METAIVIFSIVGALLIGTMSPGPSFVVVAQIALAQSRRNGFAAALGMGLGGVVYAGLALLGLHLVLAQVEWLYLVLKFLGGSYLLFLAYRLWKGAGERLDIAASQASADHAVPAGQRRGFLRALLLGLGTQLSNPKTAIVYSSIFAAFLPAGFPLGLSCLLLGLIFLIETGWYALVAATLSSQGPRAVYLRAKTWIDRLAGSVMGLLGARLITDS